jgi:hypothetical protein
MCRAKSSPIPWKSFELLGKGLATICFGVEVRTVRLRTVLLATDMNFVVQWMILGFLPPMSTAAAILLATAIDGIVLHEGFHDPGLAVLAIIVK